ncbi:serine/threonine-protein kinase STY8-like isoform X2 [Carica papaya]|uniref:serine/threonine-protein kinase STY8-like isoform X1 n=1 Tax=Carica papaya TaxID=3649 RepID=UPI000B8CBC4B|nr:serine/threonine-protein kinase STY8-like isoform X1 [Carica papaya]XP_021902761.1 serine/threonine-protein kinase STY8-like isoform X2 [Carica papaya]
MFSVSVTGDTESCSSRAVVFAPSQSRKQRQKVDVCIEILCRLRELNIEEASLPGFEDELWAHFHKLPTRCSLDVNAERALDVLMHKKLLDMARDSSGRPAMEFLPVQVFSPFDRNHDGSVHLRSLGKADAQCSDNPDKGSIHPPPTFGSSPDLKLVYAAKNSNFETRMLSQMLVHVSLS